MRNPVKRVARDQFLPEPELVQYAIDNASKFSIDLTDPTNPIVSNFHVDDMLATFQSVNSELCKHTYAARIEQIKKENAIRNQKILDI